MKKVKINIQTIIIILLIGIIISLIFTILNMKNENIVEQKIEKEQLEKTTANNAYVSMETHLSELSDATKVDENIAATEEDIAEGKQAWVNGELIQGTQNKNDSLYILGSKYQESETSFLGQNYSDFNRISTGLSSFRCLNEPIDITNASKMVISIHAYASYSVQYPWYIGIGLSKNQLSSVSECYNSTYQTKHYEASDANGTIGNKIITIEYDCSNLTGYYYPFVYYYQATGNAYATSIIYWKIV